MQELLVEKGNTMTKTRCKRDSNLEALKEEVRFLKLGLSATIDAFMNRDKCSELKLKAFQAFLEESK